ncbi:motility associated factor glycosyltransferase family protein [Paenibacillus sp. YIM B09110]|uniref:motility associated factor glycosyltransferase family protein n=1 Tax=Paenibacillus sp. YIM B09110 TaxID=3126102 RepID=UPI00301BE74F
MHNEIDNIFEIIEDIKLFLPRLEKACDSVSELFYDKMTTESWDIFSQVIAGIDDLYKTLNAVNSGLLEHEINFGIQPIINSTCMLIEQKYHMLNTQLDNDRHIAVGDIIRYEFKPLIQELSNSLGEEKQTMENRFQLNLKVLMNDYPETVKRLKQLKRDHVNYQIINAKNGMPNLHVRTTTGDCAPIYSLYDPSYEAIRWTERIPGKVAGYNHTIVFGFGFGYHLHEAAHCLRDTNVYVIEPDEQVFLAAIHAIDLETYFQSVVPKEIFLGQDKVRLGELLRDLYIDSGNKIATIDLPSYNHLFYNEKLKLKELIHQASWSYLVNISTMNILGLQHVKNVLYNIAANLSSTAVTTLQQSLHGLSAIIVGAGPSLEKDIHVLKRLKNHALIIAAGSAIQSLQHYGVEPHLVVSMDGGEENFKAFKEINRKNIPMVYIPQINYQIMDIQYDNTFHAYFKSDPVTNYFMETPPVFHSNYSVTGTAIQLAVFLGCAEIIFTGQDLSYPTESMYATGAKHIHTDKMQSTVEQASELIENVQGGMNRTNMKMQVTLANIEKEVQNTDNVQFINASQLGAKIENTKYELMESVANRLCDQQSVGIMIEQVLGNHKQAYDDSQRKEIEAKLREMPQLIAEVDDIVSNVKKRLDKLQLLGQTNPNKCLESMAIIEDYWGSIVNSKPFIVMYVYVLGAEVHVFDRKLPELAEEKNIQRKAEMFVTVLGKLIDRIAETNKHLTEYLEESIARIERLTTT